MLRAVWLSAAAAARVPWHTQSHGNLMKKKREKIDKKKTLDIVTISATRKDSDAIGTRWS